MHRVVSKLPVEVERKPVVPGRHSVVATCTPEMEFVLRGTVPQTASPVTMSARTRMPIPEINSFFIVLSCGWHRGGR